jgi:hypothetical protein
MDRFNETFRIRPQTPRAATAAFKEEVEEEDLSDFAIVTRLTKVPMS